MVEIIGIIALALVVALALLGIFAGLAYIAGKVAECVSESAVKCIYAARRFGRAFTADMEGGVGE